MFYYLAKKAQNAAQVTAAFIQKGISGLTQAKLSDLPYMARAMLNQVAYDGYKANIDVFIYATVMKTKVYTTIAEAPFPALHQHSFPLPTPSIYFQFKKEPNAESKAKMLKAYARFNIQEHVRGKTTVYTMSSPAIPIVIDRLVPVVKESTIPVSGYISIPSYIAAITLYRIIDGFLAVNTYPFSRSEELGQTFVDEEGLAHIMEIGIKLKRGIQIGDPERKTRKKARALGQIPDTEGMEVDDEGPESEVHVAPLYQETISAKPSPIPSSYNYGAPKDIPFLPGIAFPYFHGQLAADLSAVRDIVVRYFARNLPLYKEDTKQGIRRFRSDIAGFLFEPLGLIVQHILKGIELALESQTQLFLVLDNDKYLGFVLLGGCWSFFDGEKWVDPAKAEDLRNTVQTWVTHDITLDNIAGELNRCKSILGREPVLTAGDINTSMKLARAIGGSVLSDEVGKEVEKSILDMIPHLTFPTKFKGFGKETVQWALEMLTTNASERLSDDLNVYIPRSNLALLAKREMLVFSAFGPLGPNFYSTSGTEYPVFPIGQTDTFLDTDDKGKPKNPSVVIGVAPPSRCVASWESVEKRRKVRFEPNERSKESRCHVFKGKAREDMWDIYRKTIGTIVTDLPSGKGKEKMSTIELGIGAGAEGIDTYEW
jgi:hypothetical protein